MRKRLTLLALLLLSLVAFAQELPQLAEKQGTFQILSRTDFTALDCGFTNPTSLTVTT